jgi:hypothetical protein
MKRIVLMAAVLLAQCGIAQAACHPDPTVGTMVYNGAIGKVPVRVALIFANGTVDGRYAYQVSKSDIVLKGSLDPSGKHLTLHELDSAGHPDATFDGTFADHDPAYTDGTALNCEIISGKWTATGKSPVDFKLSNDSSGAMTFAHFYDAAGVTNDETVNKAATAFRDAVIHNQRDVVAKAIVYPVNVSVNGKATKIANAQALLAHYDGIFTPAYRATIAGDIPRLMFARDQGVMLGGGEVWFNPDGKVIALNN